MTYGLWIVGFRLDFSFDPLCAGRQLQELDMRYVSILAVPVSALALIAGTAAGAETRSSMALPKEGHGGQLALAQNAHGPKNGFPENRGLERAMERANEHARFKRCDSEG
jgi:hypothetical protein